MTTTNDASLTLFGYIGRIFTFHNGALVIISALPSIGLSEAFDALLGDTPLKSILLPLAVSIVAIFSYGLMFLIDFLYGLYTARQLAGRGKEFFVSAKAYSSIFKGLAVVCLIFILTLFSMICALAAWDWTSKGLATFAALIGIMGAAFDFASIGENNAKLNDGKQHKIFIWLRSITELIEDEIMLRIKGFFGAFKRQPPKDPGI